MKAFLIIIGFCFFVKVNAQYVVGSNIQAVGNGGVAVNGIFSLTRNQAGIVHVQKPIVAINCQQFYSNSELYAQSVLFALPLQSQSKLGFNLSNFGIPGTSSLFKAGISYARKFQNFHSALTVNYFSSYLKNYASSSSFTVDIGMQYQIFEDLRFGFLFSNVSRETFDNTSSDLLPSYLGAGVVYDISQVGAGRRS